MAALPQRAKAAQMLCLATALWPLSFPTMKALLAEQEKLLPARSSWFFASVDLVFRFGGAALLLWLSAPGSWRRLTRLEISQGVGLGLLGGLGILLQMDGLA